MSSAFGRTTFTTLLIMLGAVAFSSGASIKQREKSETTLNVCALVEKGDTILVYNYQRAAAAIDMAIEHANEVILPRDTKIKLHYKSGGEICASNHKAIDNAMEWLEDGLKCHLYLGPGCDRAVADLYRVAAYHKTPVIGCPASNIVGNTGLRRSELPMLVRPAYTFTDVCRLLITFLDKFNYTHTSIIADENNQFSFEFGDSLIQRFRRERRDLYKTTKILLFRSDEATPAQYAMLLGDASRQSRVILFFANATIVRNLMLHAFDLGMTTGDYVYIAVELFQSNYWGEMTWNFNDVRDMDAKLAYRTLALITLYENHNKFFVSFAKEVRTRSREEYNFTFGAFEEVDPIVTSFYDAIILYASAVVKILQAGRNVSDGVAVARAMRNWSISSPLGYSINMDVDGDRSYAYTVKQLSKDSGKFDDILRIDYHNMQETWYGRFKWPGRDTLPPDTPHCGFDGRGCVVDVGIASQPGSIAGLTVGVLIALLGSAVGMAVYIKRKNVGMSDPYWWRVRTEELRILSKKLGSASKSIHSGMSGRKTNQSGDPSQNTRKTGGTYNSSNAIGQAAVYMGNNVTLIELPKQTYKPSSTLIKELCQIKAMNHPNLRKFVGIALDDHNFCEYVVTEVCSKGTLDRVLADELVNLDWSFKYSMVKDIAEGMNYLHDSLIISHGFLTGFNCLIDARFSVKIANYGIATLVNPKDLLPPEKRDDDDRDFTLLLWRAPELLRQTMQPRGTQPLTVNPIHPGDVYSFAIILQQIILRSAPYSASDIDNRTGLYNNQGSHREIVLEVKEGSIPPMRPNVPRNACSPELYQMMEQCWSEFPSDRPAFVKIIPMARKIVGKGSSNIVEHLLERMELYANNLEEQVNEKTRMFMQEKERSAELLGQLLPKVIAEALTKGENIMPESYESVTIYFSDIVGFTTICAVIAPMDVVSLLNSLYTLFDGILGGYDCYKVETIGDAYMVASGLPLRNGKRHSTEIAMVSLQIRREIASFEPPTNMKEKLQIRIGIHSGSCVAGIVGHKMPRYCLFGDTVNTASRMESTGEPMKIQMSEKTQEMLEKIGGFTYQLRGEIPVKGKGTMKTYWLTGLSHDSEFSEKHNITEPEALGEPLNELDHEYQQLP